MSNNYEFINGKDQNISNENLGKSEKYNRVIEIPVQHISSGESNSNFNREKSPLYNLQSESPHRSGLTGFPKSSIFERFESPFDSPLSHRFDNRELDNRFPLLSRFDDKDDFFEPHLIQNHHNPIFDREGSKNFIEKLNNQSSQRQNNNNINGSNFYPRNNHNIDTRNSPDSQSSPMNYISQAFVQPNFDKNSNPKTVPIKIHHKSTSPQKSDFTVTDSLLTDGKISADLSSPNLLLNQDIHKTNNSVSSMNNNNDSYLGSKNSSSQDKNISNFSNEVLKISNERCQNISNELNNLEKEVEKFNGRKGDKMFLKLEEFLTRCLLKLDEIERGDDQINQTRKRLINLANELSDKLDLKANSNNSIIDNNYDIENENNNEEVSTKSTDPEQKTDEKSINLKENYQTSYLTVNPN